MRTFSWKKTEIEGLPDIAVMPCGHDFGKFNGKHLQCCSCGEEFDAPKENYQLNNQKKKCF
ncbi:MAG TPA: hypothetical protein VJW20_20195 [Candidatus Angelobacter sp.]|nr:hypothetical protein [Candidatus Angelobacter sp.]